MTSMSATPSTDDESARNRKRMIAIALVVAALVVAGIAAVWWWFSSKDTTSIAASTKSGTVLAAGAASTQPAANPCMVMIDPSSAINACNNQVYIRSLQYDGIDYPRMVAYRIAYGDNHGVRALSSKPCDASGACLWRLASRPNGNVQIFASNNDALRVIYDGAGNPTSVTTDPSQMPSENVCAEFALRYNATAGGYTISIPDNYAQAGTQLGLDPGMQADQDPTDPGGVVMVVPITNPATPNLWRFEI